MVLLAFSLAFYAWGEPVYVFLMIVSILANWTAGIAIGKAEAATRRRAFLVVALLIDLGILGFFKYQGFLADNINALAGSTLVPNLELPLPIGISFFTLQAVSYIIDVYTKKVTPQKNLLNLGMYIALFPQLIAGPIVRYETIEEQVNNRVENLDDFTSGLRLFIIGLAKKVLLANNVAILAESMMNASPSDIGFIGAWAGIVAYSFQIFFDFSGYSDMAIGLGKMFGFKYLRNFNYPYIAKSITEFWRRWHISLSSFFRDYVYIPLGGNRVAKSRWLLNIMIVWGLTGLWHGAAWNFVLWGLYYGIILIFEKLVWGKLLERLPRIIQHFYVIVLFIIGWVFFRATSLEHVGGLLASMFGLHGFTGTMTFWELHAWEYWPLFIICALASTPVIPWLRKHIENYISKQGGGHPVKFEAAPLKGNEHPPLAGLDPSIVLATGRRGLVFTINTLVDIGLVVLLVFSIFAIVSGSFNPFIYFQF
ncbi:MAG: MBOAT family protein [Coriobacteriia bacterium]|nr:MBOAT family protein [Coriobacteriia bacterium]